MRHNKRVNSSSLLDLWRAQCDETHQSLQSVQAQLPQLLEIAQIVTESLRSGGKILTCGNGGSAAEAQHFAEELVGRYKSNRRSLPALSLVADGTLLTCILNDFGPDELFARQVDSLACRGDVLFGLTTSGNSENVRCAIERANNKGVTTVALSGRDGGQMKGLPTHEIIIEAQASARIQEAHLLCVHLLCEAIDLAFAEDL